MYVAANVDRTFAESVFGKEAGKHAAGEYVGICCLYNMLHFVYPGYNGQESSYHDGTFVYSDNWKCTDDGNS